MSSNLFLCMAGMKRRLSMSMYRSELTDSLAVIYHIASTIVSLQ